MNSSTKLFQCQVEQKHPLLAMLTCISCIRSYRCQRVASQLPMIINGKHATPMYMCVHAPSYVRLQHSLCSPTTCMPVPSPQKLSDWISTADDDVLLVDSGWYRGGRSHAGVSMAPAARSGARARSATVTSASLGIAELTNEHRSGLSSAAGLVFPTR